MTQVIDAFDPAATTSGEFDPRLGPDQCGAVVLWNESKYNLILDLGESGQDILPAMSADVYVIHRRLPVIRWRHHSLLTMNAPPISQVWGVSYGPRERVTGTFPVAINRQVTLGNDTISTTGANRVISNGEAAGTVIIQLTEAGSPAANVTIDNSGNITIQETVAGAVVKLLQIIRGAAAGDASLILGRLNQETLIDGPFRVNPGPSPLDNIRCTTLTTIFEIAAIFSSTARFDNAATFNHTVTLGSDASDYVHGYATLNYIGPANFEGTLTKNSIAVVLTNDARLSDARTPTAHAASHAAAGSDPLTGYARLAATNAFSARQDITTSGTGDTNLTQLQTRYGAAVALVAQRAGGTQATPAALATNDILLNFDTRPWLSDTGAFATGRSAGILIQAAEAIANAARGTYITLYTTPVGSATAAEALRIAASRAVLIGRTTGLDTAGDLDVNNRLRVGGNVGFYGTTPVAKPAVTGSRGGNAALASLLTQLATLGLITDSTTA